MAIVVYTTPTCGFCHQLKNYFRQRGIPFVEHDVSQDPYRAQEMVRVSGQQGVPVSVVDGQVIVGADISRINQLLAQRAQRPNGSASPLPMPDGSRPRRVSSCPLART